MKLLFIVPGTPVSPATTGNQPLLQLDTLSEGKQYFVKAELINNLQTIAAIAKTATIEPGVKSFSNRKNPFHIIKGGLAIRKFVQQNKTGAVYVFWGGISGWVTTLFSPVPVILCLLGSDLMGSYTALGKKTFFGKLLIYFTRLAGNRAKAIVVMSEKMRTLLRVKEQFKTVVIPEGVDMQKFYPMDKTASRKRLGMDLNKPVVMFFDSGAYVKNAGLAMAAFEQVKRSMPSSEMLMVKGIAHDELVDYYNAADLLLLTSFHEGSNNSIKEALACNCPVVCTNAGDARERLMGVEPSFVIDKMDKELLAEKMLQILQQPARSNGRLKVEEVSVENVAKRIVEKLNQWIIEK